MTTKKQVYAWVDLDMHAKFLRLGGSEWVRKAIKRAEEPLFPNVKKDPAQVGGDTRPRRQVARMHGLTLNQVDYARRKVREATRPRY
jgi:hypothetical protein